MFTEHVAVQGELGPRPSCQEWGINRASRHAHIDSKVAGTKDVLTSN